MKCYDCGDTCSCKVLYIPDGDWQKRCGETLASFEPPGYVWNSSSYCRVHDGCGAFTFGLKDFWMHQKTSALTLGVTSRGSLPQLNTFSVRRKIVLKNCPKTLSQHVGFELWKLTFFPCDHTVTCFTVDLNFFNNYSVLLESGRFQEPNVQNQKKLTFWTHNEIYFFITPRWKPYNNM